MVQSGTGDADLADSYDLDLIGMLCSRAQIWSGRSKEK